jgi:hypothetical protein
MNWLDEQYQNERRADDLRAAQRQAEIDALLPRKYRPAKPRQVRRAVGNKLVEWGERLQETQQTRRTSTSKI